MDWVSELMTSMLNHYHQSQSLGLQAHRHQLKGTTVVYRAQYIYPVTVNSYNITG